VRPETTSLLLEAANFDPLTVLRTSRRLRLRTESSTRWEKGVDPYAAEQAAIYATQLFAELAGARFVGHVDVNDGLPEPPRVRLDVELTDRLTGMHIPAEEQIERLRSLGFGVDESTVTVPTWRARDVTRPVDLVEEVARFRIEDVGATLPLKRAEPVQLTREQRLRRVVEDVLAGAGFYEAYTWTFVPPGEGRIELQEPQSAELAALRTDLSHWLVESAERNRNVGVESIALFELARVFLPSGEQLPHEPWHVAGITDAGFTGAKGAIETLYRALHVEPRFEPGTGREAVLPEGTVRELTGGWGYFELDLDALFGRVPDVPQYEDVITYPAVKQDLAFVVDEAVTAGELVAAAHEAAGPELRELRPFDVYRGEQVGPGKKSIAFAAVFQSPERTLSDADAAAIRQHIVEALQSRFAAVLRA
jgi:phenylalanyl-tRNA synthetase beta chain